MTTPAGRTRRLSAIMIADIVAFSALVEKDMDGTIALWMAARADVIGPKLEKHSGRLVKYTGDGFLAEFAAIQDAVNCAVEMQEALVSCPLDFRLGVSLGDVIDDAGDILGEGVNMAARIEALAPPGGVALSGGAWEAARNRVDVRFADGGLQQVKNIAEPTRIWVWHPSGDVGTSSPARRAEADVPLVLVEAPRPSGDLDEAQDLSDDIHDALVMSLSRRQGARVVTEVTGEAGPRYTVSGRCRVSDGRCRVQLNLYLAATHQNIWSRRYDGSLADRDAFVDEVVHSASFELRVTQNAYEGSEVAGRPDAELDVGDLLSKAAFLFYRHDPKSTELSRATMERAVALAPDNAMAVSMLAWSLAHMVPYLEDRVADVDVERAMRLADRAIDLNPQLDFAFHCRAWLRLWLKRDHAGSLADAERMRAINPDYHKGPQDRGLALIFMGRIDEGIATVAEVMRLAPSEPVAPLLQAVTAIGHLVSGNRDAARRCAGEAHGRRPLMHLQGLVQAAALAGDPATRTADFRAMVERFGLRVADVRDLPFAREQDAAALEALLREAGVPE